MITINMTPQTYETIMIALKLADDLTKKHDAIFMSNNFEEVLEEINIYEIALDTPQAKSKEKVSV